MKKTDNGDLSNLYFTRALLSKIVKNDSELKTLQANKERISKRKFSSNGFTRSDKLNLEITSINSQISYKKAEIDKLTAAKNPYKDVPNSRFAFKGTALSAFLIYLAVGIGLILLHYIGSWIVSNYKTIFDFINNITIFGNFIPYLGHFLDNILSFIIYAILGIIAFMVIGGFLYATFANLKDFLLILCAGIPSIAWAIGYIFWRKFEHVLWLKIAVFATPVFFLILAVILGLSITSKKAYILEIASMKKREDEFKSNATIAINIYKNDIIQLEEQKRKYQQELIIAKNEDMQEHQEKTRKFEEEKQLALQKSMNDIRQKKENTSNLLKTLAKQSLVDERDWENLDLLIYELETGRADSIKEALQQTDLLIRHNEIKQAIGKASEAICNTIQQSMSEISFSIESNMLRIHDDFISLSEEQRRIQQSLRDVVSAQELSNALREKANVSSEQLAADVKRLRELEDYRFYRS